MRRLFVMQTHSDTFNYARELVFAHKNPLHWLATGIASRCTLDRIPPYFTT